MEQSKQQNATGSLNDDTALLASVEGQAAMLSDEECVFHRHDNGEAHVMTLDVLQAMGSCKEFKTRTQHIEAIAAEQPHLADNKSAIDSMLTALQQRGLVETTDDLVRRAVMQDQVSGQGETDAVTDVFLMLGDLPGNGDILLNSLASLQDQQTQSYRYIAVERSHDAAVVHTHKDAVARAGNEGLNVQYLDQTRQQRIFHTCLADSGLTDSADQIGQLNPLNAVNLLTAGRRFLMLDDRHDLQARTMPHGRLDRINLRSPVIFPAEFVPDDALFDGGLGQYDDDPLALQTDVLGQSVASLLTSESGRQLESNAIRGMSWLQLHDTIMDTTILSTQPGCWGDSRIDSSLWYYSMPWQMTAAMRLDEKKYRSLLHRPRLTEFYPSLQVATQSKYLPTGVDNRQLTPPVSNSPDDHARLWYAWLRFTRPDSRVMHLPVMHEFRHARQGESPYAEEYVPSFNRFMAEYIGTQHSQFRADYPEHRSESLATLYRDLSAASDHDCITMMREYLAYLRAGIISQLQQQLLSVKEVPTFWYDDVTEWITVHGNALQRSDLPAFRGWEAGLDEAAIADRMRQELDQAADLLEIWTPLWHSCMGRSESLLAQ